jgi:hypothetical protein
MYVYITQPISKSTSILDKNSERVSFENVAIQKQSNKNATMLYFSGYDWNIRNYGSNPGPNNWTNSPDNVWVDGNGWLHLKITCVNGTWLCAEISTTQALGYGSYCFQVLNSASSLDDNIVLGLYAYKDDTHEVDVELSRWGTKNLNDTWFTVQPKPYVTNLNQESFNNPFRGSLSTYKFIWTQSSVYFEAAENQASNSQYLRQVIHSFHSPTSINAEGAKANINLWLNGGLPPVNNQSCCEFVIKSFSFIPS